MQQCGSAPPASLSARCRATTVLAGLARPAMLHCRNRLRVLCSGAKVPSSGADGADQAAFVLQLLQYILRFAVLHAIAALYEMRRACDSATIAGCAARAPLLRVQAERAEGGAPTVHLDAAPQEAAAMLRWFGELAGPGAADPVLKREVGSWMEALEAREAGAVAEDGTLTLPLGALSVPDAWRVCDWLLGLTCALHCGGMGAQAWVQSCWGAMDPGAATGDTLATPGTPEALLTQLPVALYRMCVPEASAAGLVALGAEESGEAEGRCFVLHLLAVQASGTDEALGRVTECFTGLLPALCTALHACSPQRFARACVVVHAAARDGAQAGGGNSQDWCITTTLSLADPRTWRSALTEPHAYYERVDKQRWRGGHPLCSYWMCASAREEASEAEGARPAARKVARCTRCRWARYCSRDCQVRGALRRLMASAAMLC